MTTIRNRYDFVLLFDVQNGNPNGDPDAGNLPRMDPETGLGLVSDVCIKRKVRNWISEAKEGESGFEIYVQEGAVLNEAHRKAYRAVRADDKKTKDAKRLSPQNESESEELRNWMCANYFDIRAFGAVMSTGVNCGQVRGPVQLSFARSVESILPVEVSITRMAATNAGEKKGSDGEDARIENRTMGRKHVVPYGLYRAHGFVNAKLAEKTGFSGEDMDIFWKALANMFELDRSAARGMMSTRRVIAFQHDSPLGNAHAHELFDRVSVARHSEEDGRPARSFADYAIEVDEEKLPSGVEIVELHG